ncbi:MAG UNVERIFIED_CONTAM: hypothetical protein LVR18_05765 [Planctomycetaceae bacterium]
MCLPAVFPALPDLLLLNDESGSFRDHSTDLPESNRAGKGLGVLVMHSAPENQAMRPKSSSPTIPHPTLCSHGTLTPPPGRIAALSPGWL